MVQLGIAIFGICPAINRDHIPIVCFGSADTMELRIAS